MNIRAKAILVDRKADEAGRKLYTFRATTEAVDRQGEVVTLDGWEMASYEANPVILDSHNYFGIENIVGRAVGLRMTDAGLEADVVFADTERGRLADQLVDGGFLRAVSVGFRSKERARGTEPGAPLKHTRKELLEISVVAVPANQEALRVRSLTDVFTEAIAAGGDALVDEVKAGRAISRKNELKLRSAVEALNEVLGSLGEQGGDPEQGKGADALDPEEKTDLDVSSFAAFLNRKEG